MRKNDKEKTFSASKKPPKGLPWAKFIYFFTSLLRNHGGEPEFFFPKCL